MPTIKKKCWSELFEKVLNGKKNFDLRLNDFEIRKEKFILECVIISK